MIDTLFFTKGEKDGEWVLAKKYETKLHNGAKIKIPKGYKTNFASVPKPLQVIIRSDDIAYTNATLVHDYLYDSKIVSRKMADIEMFVRQSHSDKHLWRYVLMFLAVRLFGKSHYGN